MVPGYLTLQHLQAYVSYCSLGLLCSPGKYKSFVPSLYWMGQNVLLRSMQLLQRLRWHDELVHHSVVLLIHAWL
jgi:hypothetical protein